MIYGNQNGAVSLYYDNNVKLETQADRVNIYGHVFAINGSYYISNGFVNSNARFRNSGGSNDSNLEFFVRDSGTEIEALEIAKDAHIRIPNDNKKLKLGAGDDLQIFHQGTYSRITNTTGVLAIGSDSVQIESVDHSEILAKFIQNSQCELYYDNSIKFTTNSVGARINGQARYADDSGTTGGFTHCLTSGTVANNGTFTAQTHNCHAGGLVTITTNRRPSGSNNKNISVFPIVINSTSTASLGTAISAMAGSSGSSFSVSGASQGVIVTNTSGLDQRITVRFDITGI